MVNEVGNLHTFHSVMWIARFRNLVLYEYSCWQTLLLFFDKMPYFFGMIEWFRVWRKLVHGRCPIEVWPPVSCLELGFALVFGMWRWVFTGISALVVWSECGSLLQVVGMRCQQRWSMWFGSRVGHVDGTVMG